MNSASFQRFETIAREAQNYSIAVSEETGTLHPFDERNIHPAIATVSKGLFDDGHYAQATFEAYKYIDKEVQTLSHLSDSGFKLMMNAFNESGAKIQLTRLSNPSEVDEQQGYKHIFSGAAMAIRNPRGHEHSLKEAPDECLDHLSLASLLKRKLDERIA